jgi:hypothetical protein
VRCRQNILIAATYKREELEPNQVTVGRSYFTAHNTAVVADAKLSPDGTTVATCSTDGVVKFFSYAGRVFKEYYPVPVNADISGIWFLDDYTKRRSNEQLWSNMLVGLRYNSVLALVDTRTWTVQQMIDVLPPQNTKEAARYAVSVDPAGRFFLLSLQSQEGGGDQPLLLFQLDKDLQGIVRDEVHRRILRSRFL